jgi:hypothetical protein
MKRLLFVVAGAGCLAVWAAVTSPATGEVAPLQPLNFVYDQACGEPVGAPQAGFAIPGTRDLPSLGAEGTEQIWIDLSLFNNGFAPGTFIGAGPFVPRHGALEFRWYNLQPVRMHYYRLNALRAGKWIELGRGSFETINCGVVEAVACSIGNPAGATGVQFDIAEAYSPPGRPALEQWFDLTLFANPRNTTLDNGFLSGTFIGAGPFLVAGTHFWWSGLLPGRRHFYRKNVLHAGTGWEQTYSGSFVSLDCRGLPAFDAPG